MTTTLMRNRTAEISKIPKPPSRRSIFEANWNRKQTMNASFITPIMCKKVVPGQTMYLDLDAFVRLNTQITCPIDNLQIETFAFYAPERIAWENHPYFIGAVKDPNEPKSYTTPQIEIPAEKNTAGSLFNYLSGARIGKRVKVSKIPFVIHNIIQNEYFRDSDCESPKKVDITDADGDINDYDLYRIHKSRDYFTNSTRDIQSETVTIPIGTSAPVYGTGQSLALTDGTEIGQLTTSPWGNPQQAMYLGPSAGYGDPIGTSVSGTGINASYKAVGLPTKAQGYSSLEADLTNAQGATLNALAQAIMTNEYLQAINRGGNKYVDVMNNIFDVTIPDLTIQRPMYLGGTSTPFFTNQVVQTSGTGITDQSTAQGNIAGYGTGGDSGNIINCSFQEFGYVIVYAVVKSQPQYQQGLNRQWTEKDKFEYFNPFFVNAPDQPIYREEIFVEDYDAEDEDGELLNKKVFGYIGRYDHLRYNQNEIAGELNSEYEYTLDSWHYAEKFEEAPENNEEFMKDKTYEILDRTMAIVWENSTGIDENGNPIPPEGENLIKAPQIIWDCKFSGYNSIPIPTHAVQKLSAFIN